MPQLLRNTKLRLAKPALSNAQVFENTNTNVAVSVNTDGYGGELLFVQTSDAAVLDAAVIESTGESVAIDSGAGTYTLDHTATVTGGQDYYYNIVHKNGTMLSDVLHYQVTTPAAPDTEAPIISLIGDADVTVSVGDAFSDLGANVTDNVDAARIIFSEDSVDTNTVGTYLLHYDTQDAAGNLAARVTRTVHVIAQVKQLTYNVKLRVAACRVDAFTNVVRAGNVAIDISSAAVAPTVANTTVTGLNVNSVDNHGDGTYTINCSVPVDLAMLNGTNEFTITIGTRSIKHNATVLPQEGWEYIALVSPRQVDGYVFYNHLNDDPATGGQLEWSVVSKPADVTVGYDASAQLDLSWLDDQNTSNVTLSSIVIVQVRYIHTDGEIGDTAVVSYSMSIATVVPTINTVGGTTINIDQGDAFNYPAWTWDDDAVSDQSIAAEDWSGAVDVNTVGSYTLTASATNAVGTTTEDLTVTVNAVVVNTPATGAPVISGVAEQGETLSSDLSSIADADGLGAFSLQWLRDGVAISGANSASYTLVAADVDTVISLLVTFNDGQGTLEQVESSSIGPIQAATAPNNPATGLPVVTGTLIEGRLLTADVSAISDIDGLGVFAYQWLRNGSPISSATASTYSLTSADVGAMISVRIAFTDGEGFAESADSVAVGTIQALPPELDEDAPVLSGPGDLEVTIPADQTVLSRHHYLVQGWIAEFTAVDAVAGNVSVVNDLPENILLSSSPLTVTFTASDGANQTQATRTLTVLQSEGVGDILRPKKGRYKMKAAVWVNVEE